MVRRPALRVQPLEGREVPTFVPQFWFLSSAWVERSSEVVTPPPTPTPGPTAITPTVTLAAASDTGTTGDKITTLATVGLDGTTSPNATVRIVQTGATATADATGAFQFTGVPLTAGANTITVRASLPGGPAANTTTTITRQSAPTLKTALTPVAVTAGNSTTVDLAGTFDDADITNTQVRFNTSKGPVNVELFDKQAPKTVANFLNYVTDGDYTNSIFHRSASPPGAVRPPGRRVHLQRHPDPVPGDPDRPAVQNEPDAVNRSNMKGTLAMAKVGGDPNSATDQFFFNLGDNSANLDAQNGGFTVFGKVMTAADQAVVDQLAAIPTKDESTAAALPASQQGVFTEIPLENYTGTNFPTDTTQANYALVTGVSIVQQTEALTYSIVDNSNPAAATATITNNRLNVTGVAAGTTTLTVKATDKAGNSTQTTVTVTVA